MSTPQPFLTTVQGTRRFACSAVAVQAIILNADARVLLLSSPTKNRPDEWQIISSALEAAELCERTAADLPKHLRAAHPILGGVHHAYGLVEKHGERHPLPVR